MNLCIVNTTGIENQKKGKMYNLGDSLEFHPNVNKEPYLGQCVVCGKKVGKMPRMVRFNFDGNIDTQATDDNGWKFAVGSECAKEFDGSVFVDD